MGCFKNTKTYGDLEKVFQFLRKYVASMTKDNS